MASKQRGRGSAPRLWRGKARQAFAEFLTIPTLVIVGFCLLAAVTHELDRAQPGILRPVHRYLASHFFRNAEATSQLLGTVASGIITVTSITFSILLLAVQQSAASLTNQVFDQFLRRRLNQAYFGSFVGLALYALLILATVDPPFNPIFGATIAFLLTVAALYVLILLIYATIDQMRPAVIVEAVHDHVLAARRRQLEFLRSTRREASSDAWPARELVRLEGNGFIAGIDLRAIAEAAGTLDAEVEVVMRVTIGKYFSFRDEVAEVRAGTPEAAAVLRPVVERAIQRASQRDLDHDPAFGLEQLHTIGWTSISTSKSNPAPGLLVIRSLRDLLARWSADDDLPEEAPRDARPAPVVYEDNLVPQLLDALESLGMVASESMQHLSIAEVLRTFAVLLDRTTPEVQRRSADIVRRLISCLGDHVLTAELESSIDGATEALTRVGQLDAAEDLRSARARLAGSIGRLNNRSSRVGGEA